MSQQSKLQTLRVFHKNLNLLSNSSQEFIKGLTFLKYLQQFFYRKNVILVNVTLNYIANKCLLTLVLFVRNIRLKKYFKKIKKRIKKYKLSKKKVKKSLKVYKLPKKRFLKLKIFFSRFLFKNLKLLQLGICSFKLNLVNLKLKTDRQFLHLLYRTNKKYIEQLFPRRNPLFFDFLKISCLFSRGRVSTTTFLFILGQVFRFLLKRKHARFFHLIKRLFKMLIYPRDLRSHERTSKYKFQNKLLGLKFTIAGRLKGKLRSKKKSFLFGSLPNQSISKCIDYAQTDVFTRYGVFGLKLSTYLKS